MSPPERDPEWLVKGAWAFSVIFAIVIIILFTAILKGGG